MSAKKQWTGKEKLSIVLQGLKGCNAPLLSRAALRRSGRLYAAVRYFCVISGIPKIKIEVGIGSNKNHPGSCIHRIRLAVRMVIAMTVSEQSRRFAITRLMPNRRLHWPNFPSIALRTELSASSCFSNSGFRSLGGLPKRGPDNRIPHSAQYLRFSRLRNSLSANTASG